MEWLAPLAETPVARALIASSTTYLLVNAAHILSIGVLFGSILALDLALLSLLPAGLLPAIAPYLSRLAGVGVVLAVVTGLCLFSVRPTEYAQNPAFLVKLGLIALGILNVAVVHYGAGWRGLLAGQTPTAALRLSAAVSILIWIGAVVAGRWIGFL